MADRISSFVISFDGDAGSFNQTLGGLKTSLQKTVSDLNTISNRTVLFEKTQQNVKDAAAQVDKARAAVKALDDEFDKAAATGSTLGDNFKRQYAAAEKAVTSATSTLVKQSTQLSKLDGQLRTAGINTSDLATAQANLAKQTALASAALTLGVKNSALIAPQLAKVNAAFQTLKQQGGLTFGELSAATAALKERTDELRGTTVTLAGAFSTVKGQLLAFAAGFAAVGVALRAARDDAREFANAVGALGATAGTSQRTLDALAEGARAVAVEFGQDAVEGVNALRNIISQGIPADNSLTVLQAATAAAEASFTSLGDTTKLATTLINAFGVSAVDVGGELDKIFAASKDSGASLQDLANSFGELGPLAQSAGITVEQLVASIQVLRKSGIDTPTAITQLNKVIAAFSAPTADAALRAHQLGIEFNGLIGTIQSIASKHLSLDQLKEIVPDARSLKTIAALTGNVDGLSASLDKLGKSAGSIKATTDALENTPEEQIKRFNAAVKDLGISIGQFIGEGAKLLDVAAGIINAFNALSPSTKEMAFEWAALVGSFTAALVAVKALQIPINLLASTIPGLRSGFGGLIGGIDATTLAMRGLQISVAALIGYKLGDWLRDNVPSIRTFGDVIGTQLAAAVTDLGIRFKALKEIVTGQPGAFDRARAALAANAAQLRSDYATALDGALSRLDLLNKKQAELRQELDKTTQSASQAGAALTSAIKGLAGAVGQQLAVVETKITVISATLQGLLGNIRADASAAQAASQQALANVDAEAAAKIAGLDKSRDAELATAAAIQEIQTDAAAKKLAILNKSSDETLAIVTKEGEARRAIESQAGRDIIKTEADIAATKQSALQKIVDQYRSYINQLVELDKGHLQKIQDLEQQRVNLNLDTDAKIRALQQQGLTAEQAYNDKLLQIDELLAKARDELAANHTKSAEDLAKRAENLIGDVSSAVVDGNKVVVSAYNAQQTAIDRYQQANGILTGAIDKRIASEKKSADATGDAIDDATKALGGYQKQLDEIIKQAGQAIAQKVSLDFGDVSTKLTELQAQLDKKTLLASVKANIDDLQKLSEQVSDSLKQGITDGIRVLLDKIKTGIDDLAQNTELKLDVTKALTAVGEVQKSLAEITNVELKIKSNAADVQKQVDELAKNRDMTLTIHVKAVGDTGALNAASSATSAGASGYALGGLVRRYAKGGGVFTGRKVPGVGDQDTYATTLENGAFVLRKSASRYYGDSLLGKIARFAIGGFAAPGNPLVGVFKNGAPQDDGGAAYSPTDYDNKSALVREAERALGPIMDGARTLPRSPWGLNMIDYLEDILAAMRSALSYDDAAIVYGRVQPYLQNFADAVTNSHNMHIPAVMGLDASAGGDPYQGTTIPSRLYQHLVDKMQGGSPPIPIRLAGGGSAGTDTVPALLTPGEWVVNRNAVAKYGGRFMAALNSMAIPREALSRMLTPPQIHRFAAGGQVPGPNLSSTVAGVRESTSVNTTLHFNWSVADVFSETNVRRHLIPVLNTINRRSR